MFPALHSSARLHPKDAKGVKEPREVHSKVYGLDIDRECLAGQVLRNFSESCKYTISSQARVRGRYVLTSVAGECRNVWLSAACHTNLQPGFREILPSYRWLRRSSRRCSRRFWRKGSAFPQSLFPGRLFGPLSLVGLNLGFNPRPCLCFLEFLCPVRLDAKGSGDVCATYPAFSFPYPSEFPLP